MNRLGRALMPDVPDPALAAPNLARYMFLNPQAREFYVDWRGVAKDVEWPALRIEAGRNPYDRGLTDLIGELSTRSDDFELGGPATTSACTATSTKQMQHPVVGVIELTGEALELPGDPALLIITYTVEPATPSAQALQFLSNWASENADVVEKVPRVDWAEGDEGWRGRRHPLVGGYSTCLESRAPRSCEAASWRCREEAWPFSGRPLFGLPPPRRAGGVEILPRLSCPRPCCRWGLGDLLVPQPHFFGGFHRGQRNLAVVVGFLLVTSWVSALTKDSSLPVVVDFAGHLTGSPSRAMPGRGQPLPSSTRGSNPCCRKCTADLPDVLRAFRSDLRGQGRIQDQVDHDRRPACLVHRAEASSVMSPWKYSKKSRLSFHCGSCRRVTSEKTRSPLGPRQPDRHEPIRQILGHLSVRAPLTRSGGVLHSLLTEERVEVDRLPDR